MKTKLRTLLFYLALSWLAAAVLGTVAIVLYFLSYCRDGGTDCVLYSSTRRWIAFLLAPPIFAMQRWILGTVDNVSNFDPVISNNFGWLVLWAYYLVITWGTMQLASRFRRKSRQADLPK